MKAVAAVPKISVVIVNYRTFDFTSEAIQSLLDFEADTGLEIVLVDSASGDGSYEALKNRFPMIQAVLMPGNEGFARACNRGVANSRGEYLVFLNSDAALVEPLFEEFIRLDRDHGPAIWGCKVESPDGSVQPSAGEFPDLGFYLKEVFSDSARSRQAMLKGLKQGEDFFRVDWINGTLLFLKRDVFDRIGGFSDQIFMYGEDVEFNWRASRSGIPSYYLPTKKIRHWGGGSQHAGSIASLALNDSGRIKTFELMYGKWSCLRLQALFALRSGLRAVVFFLAGVLLREEKASKKAKAKLHASQFLRLAGGRGTRPY